MGKIEYVRFEDVNTDDWLRVLNEATLRTHLIEHETFNTNNIKDWVKDKVNIDLLLGCRIRAIYFDKQLAGWCGIQPDNDGYELAIVLSSEFWGNGLSIFKTMMKWAKELGHQQVLFHLLDTRPQYKALNRIATKVKKSYLLGRQFITYYISVD
ncbi:MAG: hypothetical protein ACMZ63_01055 [Methylotenera sp.]